jgi:transaldolase / glucose-6-phosphate isomerase
MVQVGVLVAETQREGFQDVVFIATGDSNLAMQAVSGASGELRWRRVFLLDGTDPAAIRATSEQIDFRSTLFVFANKSGKRIETHALLLYFLDHLKTEGITDPGRCFIAVTEPGSYLASHAHTYGFLKTFLDLPGIKGRFSSLIHFGLLLSALWRFEPADLATRALAMRDLCRLPTEGNSALTLAAFLAAGGTEGHNKLLFLSTASLEAATHRVGQLVGATTSKGGRGFVPVSGAVPRALKAYYQRTLAVSLTMAGDDASPVKQAESELQLQGVPLVSIALNSPAELGVAVFKWEVATALACALLAVNPFDETDAQLGKERSAEFVEGLASPGELPVKKARVREKEIELYAEGETRQQISTLSLGDALRTFFELRYADGYLSILSFVGGNSPRLMAALSRIREEIGSRLAIPVLLNAGRRCLHYFGQVYMSGPSKGLFLILTGEPGQDVAIPGARYTFGQLQLALALGDLDALESRQKLVIRLHLTRSVEQGLTDVEQVIQQALGNTRGINR